MADKKEDTPKGGPAPEGTDEATTIPNTDNANKDKNTDAAPAPEKTVSEVEQDQIDSSEGKVLPRAPSHSRGRFKRLGDWFGRHKKLSILLSLMLIAAILGGVPWTRYKLVGLVWKQQYQVMIFDNQTHLPVSSANVQLAGHQAVSNNKGQVTFKVKPGPATLQVSKKYYANASSKVLVPILKPKGVYNVHLTASGRQVPLVVVNKITGKPVANAQVQAADTEVKTDAAGHATMVLPAGKQKIAANLSANGFNSAQATVTVTSQVNKANTFELTPAGKVYFLSNLSGKIDVVKTNLDGTARQTVLAGTGFESANDTSLLASRDWKYLALKSIRDSSGDAKLLLINTSNDKVTTFDEGSKVTFNMIGWYNHSFLYNVARANIINWQNGQQALKSYDADTTQLAALDQTQAEGDTNDAASQTFANFYLLPGQLVYSVVWNVSYNSSHIQGKTNSIRTVSLTNQSKKDYKTFDAQTVSYIEAQLYKPGEIYFAVHPHNTGDTTYYEFEDNAVQPAANLGTETFTQSYPTYLLSPSGNQTFWSDSRDGKNTLFVGDKDAQNQKQLAALSDYQSYGWYTDNYLLVSKQGSQLYIMPASGGNQLKVTDYYKPAANYSGYGYGYGGL